MNSQNKYRKSWLLTIIVVVCMFTIAAGQDFSQRRLNFIAGLEWHGALSSNGFNISDIIYSNNPAYCAGGPCIPYNYERNLQGFGLIAGFGFRPGNVEFTFLPEFRYDEIYFEHTSTGRIGHAEFIFNPRLGVQYWLAQQKQQYIGFSYKVVNTRKQFEFYDSVEKVDKTFYLEKPAIIGSYGRTIGKSRFFAEFQVYCFFRGLPQNPSGPFFMYGLALYSRFLQKAGGS